MKLTSIIRPTAVTLALVFATSTALPISQAQAGGKNTAKLVAAGVIGLALGAVAVDASRHHRSHYRSHRRVHNHYQPVPAYVPPVPNYSQTVVLTRTARSGYYLQPTYRPAPAPIYQPAAPKVITYENAQVNMGPAEPWSNEWYAYCRSNYRSFNAKSGTFMGYDGRRHFCVAK